MKQPDQEQRDAIELEAFQDRLIKDRTIGQPTPHYKTETDLDDLDAEDWEYIIRRAERGDI